MILLCIALGKLEQGAPLIPLIECRVNISRMTFSGGRSRWRHRQRRIHHLVEKTLPMRVRTQIEHWPECGSRDIMALGLFESLDVHGEACLTTGGHPNLRSTRRQLQLRSSLVVAETAAAAGWAAAAMAKEAAGSVAAGWRRARCQRQRLRLQRQSWSHHLFTQ